MLRFPRKTIRVITGAAVIGCLGVGFLAFIKRNSIREVLRDKLEQSSSGSFMLDMYHKVRASTEETNSVSYSIFDQNLSSEIEDERIRDALPEFSVIKSLDLNGQRVAQSTPSIKFDSWQRSGGDSYSSKYSELDQINRSNVKELKLAWTYHSNDSTWHGNVEANPIIAGGNLFVTTPANFLVSINAFNGAENWRTAIRTPARRGLVWWPGNDTLAPRLFVPSSDGVYAIDPLNGNLIKDFGNDGHVGSSASLVAPAVDGSRLIVATTAPSMEAYEVESGKLLWKTSLIKPAPVESPPKYRQSGGLPWAGFSLDSTRSKIYVSTGNPGPILYGPSRPGRNEYSNSVVCIDTNSGEIKWSFQEVAHDLWDYDVSAPPVLVSVRRQDKLIDAVAVVTKIGNTLLLDRDTGKPIFDFRLRKAPTSRVPGERTWSYQPDVETPEPFARQRFEPSDITDIGETERATVETKLKNAKFGFFVPPAIHEKVATFGVHGGAEWPGAAVDQASGILYVPSNQNPWILRLFYSERLPNPVRSSDTIGDALYQNKCAQCHGIRREGYFERETIGNKAEGDLRATGDKGYPSLVGITASRNITGIDWFKQAHSDVERTKSVSVEEIEIVNRYLSAADHFSDDRRSLEVSYVWQLLLDNNGYPGSKPPWGAITAIDLNSGKRVWRIPFGEYAELTKKGIPVTGQPNFGGLIVTKGGLVFATGTVDQKIRAFDSGSGDQLWDYNLPAAGSAPPSTYELDGVQYVVVVATGGIFAGFKDQSDTIMAFKLETGHAH